MSSLQIREGFIIDDDEEEEDQGEGSDGDARPVVKRKREHRDREEEARLDDEDLELIGEQFGGKPKSQNQVMLSYTPLMKPRETYHPFSPSSSA